VSTFSLWNRIRATPRIQNNQRNASHRDGERSVSSLLESGLLGTFSIPRTLSFIITYIYVERILRLDED
jgi:hypothetical protein